MQKNRDLNMDTVKFKTPYNNEINISIEDATNFLIKFLRHPKKMSGYDNYGYEIYLNTFLIEYTIEELKCERANINVWQDFRNNISPIFMDACWELYTRGILRPYTKTISGQG